MNIEKAKEEIQQLADKLKSELDTPEEWPQEGDYYWTASLRGQVERFVFSNLSPLSAFKKSIGWVFRTKAEAQKCLDMLQATERVKQYIAKANKKADWVADFNDDRQTKVTWGYDHLDGEFLGVPSGVSQKTDAWKYIKPELFNQLIEDCEDDILLIMGVEV